MNPSTSRWSLLGTSTNNNGVTFFTLSCRDAPNDERDYRELLAVFRKTFGAIETNELIGPYSVHKGLRVGNLSFGLILDSPDCLDLYESNARDVPALEALVAQVLGILNEPKGTAGIG